MKFSKRSILVMGWIFSFASLGLMCVSAFDKTLSQDPSNAVQHFENVKIINSGQNDEYAIIKKLGGLVGIEIDDNFILSQTGDNEDMITNNVKTSTILGGLENKITREGGNSNKNHAILGGRDNEILGNANKDNNSILGGFDNWIYNGKNNSILGGSGNYIDEIEFGSIIGGEENNLESSNMVGIVGNNNWVLNSKSSVVMGFDLQNVKLENSFLWTDSPIEDFNKKGVFFVLGRSGMVVNTDEAHSMSQLTIGGSLIVFSGGGDLDCTVETKGVLKVMDGDSNNNYQKCFCSCDGSGWNALHEGVRCSALCSNTTSSRAECGNIVRVCNGNKYYYTGDSVTGACIKGELIQGTGAFLVSTKKENDSLVDYINWSCSYAGVVRQCSQKLEGVTCNPSSRCKYESDAVKTNLENYAYLAPGSKNDGSFYKAYDSSKYTTDNVPGCAYYCNAGYTAYEGLCYQCPEGTEPDGNGGCSTSTTCSDGKIHIGNSCVYPGTCYYPQNNQQYLGESLGKIKQETGAILPAQGTVGTLKCIDSERYSGTVYEANSCKYVCEEGYYCDGSKCKKPTCNPGNLSGYQDNSRFYYITGQLTHYTSFNLTPIVVKDKDVTTSGEFYEKYKNKDQCRYWCPEENRLRRYSNGTTLTYDCVESGYNMPSCGDIYAYGAADTYKGYPTKSAQAWTYVPPQEFEARKATGACLWTCATGSLVFTNAKFPQGPVGNERSSYWTSEYRLLFNSTAKFCYKKCNEGEILNSAGDCVKCDKIKVDKNLYVTGVVNPASLQTGKVWVNSTGLSYVYKYKRVADGGDSNRKLINRPFFENGAGGREYLSTDSTNVYSEYRQCMIYCGTGKTWDDATKSCVNIIDQEYCPEDKYYKPSSDGGAGQCVECMDSHIIVNGVCTGKVGKLELSITQTGTNTSPYKLGDTIQFEIKVINRGNLAITGIETKVYYKSGSKELTIKDNTHGLLNIGHYYSYTGTYTFGTGDFVNLSMGKTGQFVIYLIGTGIPKDEYINNNNYNEQFMKIEPEGGSKLAVTIERTQ